MQKQKSRVTEHTLGIEIELNTANKSKLELVDVSDLTGFLNEEQQRAILDALRKEGFIDQNGNRVLKYQLLRPVILEDGNGCSILRVSYRAVSYIM